MSQLEKRLALLERLTHGLKKDPPKPKGRQKMSELERRLALLERLTHFQAIASEDKLQKALILHEQAKEQTKQLRELLMKGSSGSSFETPDRKPSRGCSSPHGPEIPREGPGRCEASGT